MLTPGLWCTGAGFFIPDFINKKTKSFERQTLAYTVDGASISIGALMGTSSLTAYIEVRLGPTPKQCAAHVVPPHFLLGALQSASGIREGARTGLAALFLCFYFFLALFFTPLLASIPPYATGPALVLVGTMMVSAGGGLIISAGGSGAGAEWRGACQGQP